MMGRLNPYNFESDLGGERTRLFILENSAGLQTFITNYGARVVGCLTPDSTGVMTDIVLGFDNITSYVRDANSYFGAVVGRVANRTAGATFDIDGKRVDLDANHGVHHIHGGSLGLHQKVWDAHQDGSQNLLLTCTSRDGESGYPGEVRFEVTYSLTDANELRIEYKAVSDSVTPVNLTNHTYFNLRGAGSGSILDHICQIQAETYHPIDERLIPTGMAVPLNGSPFDFKTPRTMGAHIGDAHPQLELAGGYDHNYVLSKIASSCPAALVWEPVSKRSLEVFTDQIGLQFYTGNFLDGTQIGKGGYLYSRRSGFCLEAQAFPNSLNTDGFPSIFISPDAPYAANCAYRFGIHKS